MVCNNFAPRTSYFLPPLTQNEIVSDTRMNFFSQSLVTVCVNRLDSIVTYCRISLGGANGRNGNCSLQAAARDK